MSEWWFWEAVCFEAGQLGAVPLAAHAIAYNMIPVLFMVPHGIGIGASTRVAVMLGENR